MRAGYGSRGGRESKAQRARIRTSRPAASRPRTSAPPATSRTVSTTASNLRCPARRRRSDISRSKFSEVSILYWSGDGSPSTRVPSGPVTRSRSQRADRTSSYSPPGSSQKHHVRRAGRSGPAGASTTTTDSDRRAEGALLSRCARDRPAAPAPITTTSASHTASPTPCLPPRSVRGSAPSTGRTPMFPQGTRRRTHSPGACRTRIRFHGPAQGTQRPADAALHRSQGQARAVRDLRLGEVAVESKTHHASLSRREPFQLPRDENTVERLVRAAAGAGRGRPLVPCGSRRHQLCPARPGGESVRDLVARDAHQPAPRRPCPGR